MTKNAMIGLGLGAAAAYYLSGKERRAALRNGASSLVQQASSMMHRRPDLAIGPVAGQATSHVSSYKSAPTWRTVASLAGTGIALYGGMRGRGALGRAASLAGSRLLSRGFGWSGRRQPEHVS